MKRIFISVLVGILLAHSLFAQNNYSASGEQFGLWQYDTVFVTSDVTIPFPEQLQIAAGTKVIFEGHYSIHVQGNIRAIGQENDSIVFTVADTSGFHDIYSNAGGWNGIRFEDTSWENDSSKFEYCVLSFGKAVGDSVNCYGGAIRALRTGKIAINHSRLHNNYAFYWGGAIYAFKTDLSMEHCSIEDNYAGNEGLIYGYGGGLCFVSTEPNLRHMNFKRNSSTGIGGAVSFEYSNPLLINAVFEENLSGLGGAIGIMRSEAKRPIANLLLNNNVAVFFGGGIAIIRAEPIITNATIVNNHASMGGGYYCNDSANPALYNSILWDNHSDSPFGSQVWIWDVISEPAFYHCAIQEGHEGFGGSSFIGVYENCTEEDPLFVDPKNDDFLPTKEGSCFNAGTNELPNQELPEFDLAMKTRIEYEIVDIGAYEIQRTVGINQNQYADIQLFPVPLSANSKIRWNKDKKPISAELINQQGIQISRKNLIAAGIENERFITDVFPQIAQLSAGWYLLRIHYADGSHAAVKFIK